MSTRPSVDSPVSRLHVRMLTRNIPSMLFLLTALFVMSMLVGVISVALTDYSYIGDTSHSILVTGLLTGVLVILMPTLLTVLVIKWLKGYVKTNYIMVVALAGGGAYSLFIMLASAVYHIVGAYSLATGIILVGDASIFGWWFFISKVLLGQKKKAVLYSVIQPVINMLLYLIASNLIFTFSLPLSALLVKLAAAILIFALVSYIILFTLERPVKKSLGMGGIDAFSQVVQDWLFNINMTISESFGNRLGVQADIDTHTLVFKNSEGKIKAIMFAPWIHYGPFGTLCGSNMPYVLESYAVQKYGAPALIMHTAVNEDNNPVSSAQINTMRDVMDRSIREARRITGAGTGMSYSKSRNGTANVHLLSINNVKIATLTRAPYITEDVSPEARKVLKELLEYGKESAIILDAHNSRYESASNKELDGVKFNTVYMDEYAGAIKGMGAPLHSNRKVRVGASAVKIFRLLGGPTDMAPGNLNVVVFQFNGFKHAVIQFNANNMLPSLREDLLARVRKKYKVDAEIYTTDTHYVNSIKKNESNVLGRHTKYARIAPILDRAVKEALENVEGVEVYYKKDMAKRFRIWGPGVRERAFDVVNSVVGMAKILIPGMIVAGFILASWIISIV